MICLIILIIKYQGEGIRGINLEDLFIADLYSNEYLLLLLLINVI